MTFFVGELMVLAPALRADREATRRERGREGTPRRANKLEPRRAVHAIRARANEALECAHCPLAWSKGTGREGHREQRSVQRAGRPGGWVGVSLM